MGMNQENSYENDVTVDKYNLHTELETLPTLIAKWRKKYSIAEGILDKLTSDIPIFKAEIKMEFEMAVAKIEADLRENWDQHCPDVRATEGAVQNKVKTLPEFAEAHKKSINENLKLSEELACAVEDKGTFYGACRALEAKETALTKLVKLYLSGYYERPKITNELEKEVQKATSDNLKSKLRTRRLTK
ncbi:MAG: hypothetical protein A2W22_00590 [Candidatus Levybacteria bacterium RBG_16_35_11]|nr:MAG: hypothetical protein A2W22_00590 [Candidatus Levybacteria bacterium RBG_16_35_11]